MINSNCRRVIESELVWCIAGVAIQTRASYSTARVLLRRAAQRHPLPCAWRSLSMRSRTHRTSSSFVCCHCSCIVFSLCRRSLFLSTAACSLCRFSLSLPLSSSLRLCRVSRLSLRIVSRPSLSSVQFRLQLLTSLVFTSQTILFWP